MFGSLDGSEVVIYQVKNGLSNGASNFADIARWVASGMQGPPPAPYAGGDTPNQYVSQHWMPTPPPSEGGAPSGPNDPLNRPGYMQHVAEGIAAPFLLPGTIMKENPYRPGTEEHAYFENTRQDAINNGAPGMAMGMLMGGTPFAEAGAVGAAGGRLPAVRNPITGKLQVNPRQMLTDTFVQGGSPVGGAAEEAAAAALRRDAMGRFANTRDYGRAQTLTPDKVTAPDALRQPNAMYDPANPPGPPPPSRLEAPKINNPWDVDYHKQRMPISPFDR